MKFNFNFFKLISNKNLNDYELEFIVREFSISFYDNLRDE